MAVLALGERRQGLQPVKRTSRIVVNRRRAGPALRPGVAARRGRGRFREHEGLPADVGERAFRAGNGAQHACALFGSRRRKAARRFHS
jgi:hypothetical protein